MKNIKFISIFLFISFQFIYSINFPELTGRVVDEANVLTESQLLDLEKRLEQYENNTGNQMVVCFIGSTVYYTIEEYSIRLAEKWKIGYKGKDNGIIMLFAMSDRKMRIEVGYGLEGDLTDLEAKLLIERVLVPHFKNRKYFEGIKNAIDYIEKETMPSGEEKSKNIITKKFQPKEHKLWVKDKNAATVILVILIILGALFSIFSDLFLSNKIHFLPSLIVFIISVLYILFFSFIFKIPGVTSIMALVGVELIGVFIGFMIMAIVNPSHGSTYKSTGGYYGGYSSKSYGGSSYSGSSYKGYSGGGGSFGGGGASGGW